MVLLVFGGAIVMHRILIILVLVLGLSPLARADCSDWAHIGVCSGPTPSNAVDIRSNTGTGIIWGCNRIYGNVNGDMCWPWNYPYSFLNSSPDWSQPPIQITVTAGATAWAWFTDTQEGSRDGLSGPIKAGDAITYEPGYTFATFPGIHVQRVHGGQSRQLIVNTLTFAVRSSPLPDPPDCVLGTTPWVWASCAVVPDTASDSGRGEFTARFGTNTRLSGTRTDGTTGAPCKATVPGTSTVVTVVYDCNSRL